MRFLAPFEGMSPYVKIGMELFYSEGPDIVRAVKDMGLKVFLDLKLHDIPNTVKMAMERLGALGVDITNVHAAGTVRMMEYAKEGLLEGAAKAGNKAPLLIAVTQLTSTDQQRMEEDLLIKEDMPKVIQHYAANAKKAGLDGVVCSPLESPIIHETVGADFLTVTPGVRFADESAQDQARVTTPEKAGQLGSNFIVVGRSITKAADPVAAYKKALDKSGVEYTRKTDANGVDRYVIRNTKENREKVDALRRELDRNKARSMRDLRREGERRRRYYRGHGRQTSQQKASYGRAREDQQNHRP